MTFYNEAFFNQHIKGSLNSAKAIMPLALEVVNPRSVTDIGCGIGTWLKACKDLDANIEILGIDGDYVSREQLLIPKECFKPHDLTKKLRLEKRYDLVISLEVGEHLPAASADQYVENLVNAGDCILFSAAFLGQGGTNHVNEQLPDYWKDKFKKYNYSFYDIIRPNILENHQIERWYRQNTFLVLNDKTTVNASLPPSGISYVNAKLFDRLEYYQKCYEGKGGIREGSKIFIRTIKERFFTSRK